MRLRFKLCGTSVQSSSISIRLDDDCTLEQLRSQIVQELLKANNLGDFTLSLNKKVPGEFT